MDRLPVRTHHCRFCNHLLLATTRDLASLPRRKAPAQDAAIILPLPTKDTSETETEADQRAGNAKGDGSETEPVAENETTHGEGGEEGRSATTTTAAATKPQAHYTILLSTTIPERKPTLIRREDGFEKRLLLRCGRCRVVVGYFLDPVHFADATAGAGREDDDEGARVVYVLPGAVMETGVMGEEDQMKAMDGAWSGWVRDSI